MLKFPRKFPRAILYRQAKVGDVSLKHNFFHRENHWKEVTETKMSEEMQELGEERADQN